MKKIFAHIVSKSAAAATAVAAAALPLVVFAQTSGTLTNPTSNANITNLQGFIAAFLKAIVEISLPILTLFFVYSGFMFVAARGNETKLQKAKDNFLYVVLGAILILGAWVLATLIGATVTQVVGNS